MKNNSIIVSVKQQLKTNSRDNHIGVIRVNNIDLYNLFMDFINAQSLYCASKMT